MWRGNDPPPPQGRLALPPFLTGPQPQTVDRAGGCLTYCAACSVCSPPASVFWRSACRTDTAEVTWLPPNSASREIQSDSKPHFPQSRQLELTLIMAVELEWDTSKCLCERIFSLLSHDPGETLLPYCCWGFSACGGCWVPSYHVHKQIKWPSVLLLKLTGPFNNPKFTLCVLGEMWLLGCTAGGAAGWSWRSKVQESVTDGFLLRMS